jgi:hypothetical protein
LDSILCVSNGNAVGKYINGRVRGENAVLFETWVIAQERVLGRSPNAMYHRVRQTYWRAEENQMQQRERVWVALSV